MSGGVLAGVIASVEKATAQLRASSPGSATATLETLLREIRPGPKTRELDGRLGVLAKQCAWVLLFGHELVASSAYGEASGDGFDEEIRRHVETIIAAGGELLDILGYASADDEEGRTEQVAQ